MKRPPVQTKRKLQAKAAVMPINTMAWFFLGLLVWLLGYQLHH